jgi:hypothetical protein
MANYPTSSLITPSEARKVLGITAKDMSDDAIRLLIKQVDILTDIVVAHANGSTIKSYIDNLDDEAHTDD